MLNEPEEIAQDEQNVDITNKELKLEHVNFSYEDGKQILHDIILIIGWVKELINASFTPIL